MPEKFEILSLDGHRVKITNPDKVFFPKLGLTKMDLVRYYLDVAPGALVGCRDRPTLLKRHPNGVDGDFFYQKRVPTTRPKWVRTVTVSYPSGRTADWLCPKDSAHVAWAVNLGCIELHTWPVRRRDVDHPDELRVDIDPTPEATFDDARKVAIVAGEVLGEHGLEGFPKTSGKRGIHIYARIEPKWEFPEVRRAALALGREVSRRVPKLATTAWWKEERHGVFIDYNQNARDRTIASAYSVRPTQDGWVSCPLNWDEVPGVETADLNILTVPKRFADTGDPGVAIDEQAGGLDSLLALAERDAREGLGDEPWPPMFPKQPGERKRVQPSKGRKSLQDVRSEGRRRPSRKR